MNNTVILRLPPTKATMFLLMDGQLDVAMVSMLEQKLEKSRFTRVDSDVVDNLIVKEDKKGETLEANKQDAITTAFKSQLPKMDKVEFNVMTQALGENSGSGHDYSKRIYASYEGNGKYSGRNEFLWRNA